MRSPGASRSPAPVRQCSECGEIREIYRGRSNLCRECGRRQQSIGWEAWKSGLRRCLKCKEFKPVDNYRTATKGLKRFCIECEDAAASCPTLECRTCRQVLPRADFGSLTANDRRCRACESQRSLAQSKVEKHAAQRRKQRRERYHTDDKYRIMYHVRGAVQRIFKGRSKVESTLALLGCSVEDFMGHLEAQFVEGMTWDSFKRGAERPAEIDHIRPLSSFDLSDPEQRQEAMSFRNCQPMWRFDNRSKSDKLPDGTRGRHAPANGRNSGERRLEDGAA